MRNRTIPRNGKLAAMVLLSLAAMTFGSTAAAANFPVGTHLIKGTVTDWKNKALDSSAGVTVQAVNTNGNIIATAKVFDPDPSKDGYNFLLQIPLSTIATDKTVAVGDTLNFVLVHESELSIALSPQIVGNANAVSSVNFSYVNMKSYTDTATGETVNVPQEYIDSIAAWMEAYEIAGAYDPFADYDGDGANNYAEYRASTDPFDPKYKLAITSYSASKDAPHAISFEYVGGVVYGVSTTLSLTNPEWTTQPVKKTETDSVNHEQVMLSDDEEIVDDTTIYVVPAEGATSQFFKLEAK